MLHQRIDRAFCSRIGGKRSDNGMGCERRDQDDAAATAKNRQQLLDEEERRADIDRKEPVEILDRGLLDRRRFRDSGIGYEDIQPVADHGANLSGERVRTVRRGQIRANGLGAASGLADLGDDGVSLVGSATVMDHDLGACLGEGQRGGAAMPREAPVTSAVFPERLVMYQSFEIGPGTIVV
jgi:hypothetical protein